ncbi:MAG: 5'-3' exonuclease H3TH domain-containing protein, partial [Burkholderiales bacterium]
MQDTPTLLLVDGSSYLYRAFHAMPDLRADRNDPNSQATGAIRGMVNMLTSLRRDWPTAHAVCVFDAKGPTFRDAIYPEYKATRSPMPDDLRSQIEPIHRLVKLMGWPLLDVPGVEADDVIATLAHVAAEQGMQVVVSSGDKDLSQLVNERITIIDTMNGKKRDVAGVTEEFGVPPRLMIDYQTLVGDTVDNVPGVAKVGPKTAAKWLMEYGSLDALLEHAHEIKGVAGENLRQAREWLATGRQLVSMKTDCDLSAHVAGLPSLEGVVMQAPDQAGLIDFYKQYGFKGLVTALEAGEGAEPSAKASRGPLNNSGVGEVGVLFDEPAPAVSTEVHYDTVLGWDSFGAWLQKIEAADLVALDTETTSLVEMQAQIVGISVCITAGEAAYIPLGHNAADAPTQLPLAEVLAKLKPWLENPAKHKLGQHVKYDRHVFANHGIEVQGYVHDTMLQSYELEVHKPHGLESLADRHLGRKGLSYEDLCGKGVHQISVAQVDVAKASHYACEDADFTLAVHQRLWPLVQA